MALGSNGNAYSWGNNGFGQLGVAAGVSRPAPVLAQRGAIPAGVRITQVSAGFYFALALGSDGNVYSWGENSDGQLGVIEGDFQTAPVLVQRGVIPSGVRITQVSAGGYYAATLGSDGKVYTWGDNKHGQLGDGTADAQSAAVLTRFAQEVSGVSFDGVAATSISQNVNGAVTAVTPAHAAGTVDVSLTWTLNDVVQPALTRAGAFTYSAPPVFTTDPQDQEIADASTASFTVATDVPATITWQVLTDDGVSWETVTAGEGMSVSADGLTLTVTGTTARNGSQYRAVAKNSAGITATSPDAVLTVVEIPGFLKSPANQRVVVGSDAVFAVETDNPSVVTWEQSIDDGATWSVVVPGTDGTLRDDNRALTVTGTAGNDGFYYRAVAQNIAGAVTSAAATLTTVAPPVFTVSPADQEIAVGSTATFTVAAPAAESVTWEVSADDGVFWEPVTPGMGVAVSVDGFTLEVTGSTENDGFQYRAVAQNIAGTVMSSDAVLTVVVPVMFTTQPEGQAVVEGGEAVFTVATDTKAVVEWETTPASAAGSNAAVTAAARAWVPVTPGAGVTVSSDGLTLTVTGSTDTNGAFYRAVTRNIAGVTMSDAAQLTLVLPPEFSTNPADQTVMVGDTARFSAEAPSADTITWEVSGNNGDTWEAVTAGDTMQLSKDGGTLKIMAVTTKNDGHQYRAIATNIAGEVKSQAAALTVLETDPNDTHGVDPETNADPGATPGTNGQLSNTGSAGITGGLGGAVILLLLGTGVLGYRKRTRKNNVTHG